MRDGKVINFGFDALDRQTSTTFANPVDVTDSNVTYSYDLLGRLLLAQDVNAHKVAYSYDALGRRTSEAGAWATLASQYDPAGRRTRLTWGDGFYVTYEYDTTGGMTAIRENGGFLLASFAYDSLGRRASRTLGNGTSTSYGYDGVSNLTALGLNGGNQPNAITFGYNAAGQISSRTASNDAYAWGGSANVVRSYGANGLNQYTASGSVVPTYDARGNVTSAGVASYLYNSKNQLSGANGTYIYYDPAGRIDQVAQSGLLWDWDGNALVTEHQGGAIVKRYVHGAGMDEPIVSYDGAGTGTRRWLDADERGSIVRVTDDSGNAVAVNSYDEYGIPASGNTGRFQYTGQIWLSELGFQYSKARMYSPTLGRFMQTDPIGYADGLNWYNYVGSDPINKIDPTGTDLRCNNGRYYTAKELQKVGDSAPCEGEVVARGRRGGGNGGGGNLGGLGGGATSIGSGHGGGGGPAHMPAPAPVPQNEKKNERPGCRSRLYRAGTGAKYGGQGVTYSGLTIAGLGSPAGPVGSAPGLVIAEAGGAIGAFGQAAQDVAVGRPGLEIAGRFAVNLFGGRVLSSVVPSSVRSGLGDAIFGEVAMQAETSIFNVNPDWCPK